MKQAIVTGASRGIGKATMMRLLDEGYTVVAVSRDVSTLPSHKRLKPLSWDLLHDVTGLVKQASSRLEHPGFDLVQAAGVAHHAPLEKLNPQHTKEMFQINVKAPFQIMQDAILLLKEKQATGCIVNITSTLATHHAADTAVYAATKAALRALTLSWAIEAGPHRIRMHTLSPGLIDTDMLDDRNKSGLANLSLLGRLGTPEEVADAVLYLLGATWSTGTDLVIDGGLKLKG